MPCRGQLIASDTAMKQQFPDVFVFNQGFKMGLTLFLDCLNDQASGDRIQSWFLA